MKNALDEAHTILAGVVCGCAQCKALSHHLDERNRAALAFASAFATVHAPGTIPGLTLGDVADLCDNNLDERIKRFVRDHTINAAKAIACSVCGEPMLPSPGYLTVCSDRCYMRRDAFKKGGR